MRARRSDGEREGEVKSAGGNWERWGGKARAQEWWKGSGTESEGVETQSGRESRKKLLGKLQAVWHGAASAPSISRCGWLNLASSSRVQEVDEHGSPASARWLHSSDPSLLLPKAIQKKHGAGSVASRSSWGGDRAGSASCPWGQDAFCSVPSPAATHKCHYL